MQKITNPYLIDKIPDSKTNFFGREKVVAWAEQQIISQRQFMILHGSPLIGKTTMLRFLPQLLSVDHLFVSLAFSGWADYRHSSLMAYCIQQLTMQLTAQGVITPANLATATDAVSAIDRIIAAVEGRYPQKQVIIGIDDLDALSEHPEAEMSQFLDICQSLLTRHKTLYIIAAINSLSLSYLRHPVLDSAPVHPINPLELNDALKMITQPVERIIRFDYGVPKRIAELNSNHPYYLLLFNNALFSRCAREGWVNFRYLDETLEDILLKDIPSFQKMWQESTWVERAVLAALGSLKGSHGVSTRQEVFALLKKHDKKADERVVLTALESLAFRGILVKMGALSYRFFVDLFRYWLQKHANLLEVLRDVSWQEPAARQEPVAVPAQVEPSPEEAPRPVRRRREPWWVVLLAVLMLIGLLSLGTLVVSRKLGLFSTPEPTRAAVVAFSTPVAKTPTVTPTPLPTGTPTPTPPIVVAKSLPSIAYMARQGEGLWQINVMDMDGTGATALAPSEVDDTSPAWAPSGRELVFVSQRDGNREIYAVDIDGKNLRNLTNHPSDDWTPAWSPDGAQVVFSSNRTGNWDVFLLNPADGGVTQITTDEGGDISPVWSPDGEKIAFCSKRDGNWEIYTMRADGSGLKRLTRNEANDLSPIWNPTGDLIAYETNVDGNVEIYVMSAEGGNPRNISRTSSANDHGPAWSPDGQRLVFYSNRTGDWDLYATDLTGGAVINLTNTPDIDEQTPVWRP